jgi:Zn-dependent M28 family amino/carboxypeptidase
LRGLAIILGILVVAPLWTGIPHQVSHAPLFDGESAFDFLSDQCDFGPRPPGSENLSLCREYIAGTLESFGWTVTFQEFTYQETECVNIIAKWGGFDNASILLGAHYDTRPLATAEPNPEDRLRPVLGANDGASGTAVLMELSNILPEEIRSEVEIVLFDAEDSGGINGWNWIVGSTYYVDQLTAQRIEEINAMVLVDMVGDTNLRLPRESTSHNSLQDTIWSIAADAGFEDIFLDSNGVSVLDDHTPFLDVGIPAVDIIQYPFPSTWHTLDDTPENCNSSSLEAVGTVLELFVVDNLNWSSPGNPNAPFPYYLTVLVILPLAMIVAIFYYRRR